MKKLLLVLFLLFGYLNANTSLFYKVHKGSKDLGYYEINYNDKKSYIRTKSYGVASKVKFFVDKNIKYHSDAHRTIVFKKNKSINEFDVRTKKDKIDESLFKKYRSLPTKLKKVKNNEMLLLTKKGKKGIELFNKRPTALLTLEEVLRSIMDGNTKTDFLLFEQSGVQKLKAKLEKTSSGYDIINKSKRTKYIQITVKNGIPTFVKSYVSDWSISIYGAGPFKINKISLDEVSNTLKTKIEAKLATNDAISLVEIEKVKPKKSAYSVYYKAKVTYPDNVKDKKRFCNKTYKTISKKASSLKYSATDCTMTLRSDIDSMKLIKEFKDQLVKKYPQLKFTKKIKVSKNGAIMYKVIDRVN